MLFSTFASLLALAPIACVSAGPTWNTKKLSARASSFAFTNIPSSTENFVDGVTATIPDISSATATNQGTSVTVPITGTIGIANRTLTLQTLALTTPAIFTIDGEWYPAALRLISKEGPVVTALFILTPDEPNTPIVNSILDVVGNMPASGNTASVGALSFQFFIDTYITPDVFYEATAGGVQYYVRQLPLSMELVKWRGLKKALTVS